MRKLLLLPFFALLMSFATHIDKGATLAVNAAVRPTSINVQNLTDSEVSDYYTSIDGLTGENIKAELYNIIKDHDEYHYESTNDREIYKIIERDWDLSPLSSEEQTNFDYRNDNPFLRKLYGTYNGDENSADRFYNPGSTTSVTFDKEHIWPQSFGDFGRTNGAGSDFHSLWAADSKINRNAHSNNNYLEPVTNIKERPDYTGALGGWTGNVAGSASLVFAPLDEYKGDVARAMFYMPARYYEYIDETHPKLELVNGNPEPVIASPSVTGKAGDLATLLEWHELDPVDEFEIRRNNLIYNNYQGNRNPFIDYPQLARLVYDPSFATVPASTALDTSSVGSSFDPFGGMSFDSISVDTTNMKTNYFLGEAFTTTGLAVTAHLTSDGEIVNRVIKNYSLDLSAGTRLMDEGTISVTVTLTSGVVTRTTSFDITVRTESLSDYLFISEVFGGGGNSGAPYNQDFIEIYNYADFPLSLTGNSVQYSQSNPSNPSWIVTRLNGIIPAKSYYLVGLASGESGDDVPLLNVRNTTAMAAGNFMVALVNGSSPLSLVDPRNLPEVIDFVGAGNNNYYLVSKPATPTNTESIQRKFVNENIAPPLTKDNGLDFIKATPTPKNSALGIAEELMRNNIIDQCIALYPIMKLRVLDLTSDVIDEDTNEVTSVGELTYFQTGNHFNMSEAKQRYEAWAVYHNDDHPYEYVSLENSGNSHLNSENANNIAFVLLFIFLSFGTYFVVRNKQTKSQISEKR